MFRILFFLYFITGTIVNGQGVETFVPKTSLVDWKEYTQTVGQQFIHELEDYGLCGLFLDDFSQTVRQVFFDRNFTGTVNYTNGFMGTLQQATFAGIPKMSIDEALDLAYVEQVLTLHDIVYYFDFVANISSYEFGGTVALHQSEIDLTYKVTKHLQTEKITVYLQTSSSSSKVLNHAEFSPDNMYTQIVARMVHYDLGAAFDKLGNTTLKNILEEVTDTLPFPVMCYSCQPE